MARPLLCLIFFVVAVLAPHECLLLSHGKEIWLRSVSVQPEIYVWPIVCALLAIWMSYAPLRGLRQMLHSDPHRRRLRFSAITLAVFAIAVADFISPNVTPHEIAPEFLNTKLNDGITLRDHFLKPDGKNCIPFREQMAKFRWLPSTWSWYRAIYYIQIVTISLLLCAIGVSALFFPSLDGNPQKIKRLAIKHLGAVVACLPYVLFRRLHTVQKWQIYGADSMAFGDLLILLFVLSAIVSLFVAARDDIPHEVLRTIVGLASGLAAPVLFFMPNVFPGLVAADSLLVMFVLSPAFVFVILSPWL